MNFLYTVNPQSDEPEMVIDSHIGPDEIVPETGQIIPGIDGAQWARELLALDAMGKRRVKVYINSPGGSVIDGYNMCAAMLHTKCKVDTYCRGMAASMAAVAFMCGRNRCMADYGILMFHDPHGGENQELLDKMSNSLATLIAARSGLTLETVAAIMGRTTWLDVSQALEIEGLITEVEKSTDSNIGRLAPVKNDAKEFFKISKLIFNKSLNIKIEEPKNTDMSEFKEINNRLGLMDEASAESRRKALDEIQNKAKASDKKAEDMQAAFEKKKEEMDKMKADMEEDAKKQKEAFDKMKADYDKMKDEKDAFEKKTKEEDSAKVKDEAKNLIADAVKLGKIENKAESIEKWEIKASVSREALNDVKDLLSTMGVNRKSAAEIQAEAEVGKVDNSAFKSEAEAEAATKKAIAEHMKKVKDSYKK